MKNIHGFATVNGRECYEISVFDHGLLYGDGVYETARIFDGHAFLLDKHLDRLFDSASGIQLDMPYSRKDIIRPIMNTYKKSGLKDAFMRIIVTRGVGEQGLHANCHPNLIILCNERPFKPLRKIDITISKIRRTNKSAIDSKIKSLNYANNMLASLDAKDRGFDDAILLNENGILTEATTSNIFIVHKGKIFTPSSASGILEGAIRNAIIENFPVIEKELTVNDLVSAQEAFLTGTVDFITCIKRIDNKRFKDYSYAKKIFNKLMELSKKGAKLN